jgi:hypothetical protein
MSPPPGAILAAKCTAVSAVPPIAFDPELLLPLYFTVLIYLLQAGALGFFPVAFHFRLLETLVSLNAPSTSQQILDANNATRSEAERAASPLNLRLVQDTLFVLAGQSILDLISDDVYAPNDVTRHYAAIPSAPHGAMHFTTEALFASAFLFEKLKSTNFTYPFEDAQTPFQYGYELLGRKEYEGKHTYEIMAAQGRMDSFNLFMAGKFGKFGDMPSRVRGFGYDLDAAVSGTESDVVMVDIGGGIGEMLLEVKKAYPSIPGRALIVQEFQADVQLLEAGVQLQEWNFKTAAAQPVKGALNYSLTHIFHNLSDLCALDLMKKLSDAMAPHSRLLIHEFTKNGNYGNMHGAMICLYGGRLRDGEEWRQMARIVGLEITFEHHPVAGEGLIEMRKVGWREAARR